jgi:hypothetical protein
MQAQANMPQVFHHQYPACRVIINATEFFTMKPINLTKEQASFSTYKNNNILKCLFGIAPTTSSAITFISD